MQSKAINLSLQEMKQQLTDATGEERIDLLLAIVKESSYSPFDEVEAYTNEAIKLSKQIKHAHKLIESYHTLAEVYRQNENMEAYRAAFQKSLSLSEDLNDQTLIVRSLRGVGMSYYYASESVEAKKYFESALEKAQTHELKEGEIWAQNSLGNVYVQENIYDTAVTYFLDAIENAKLLKNAHLLAASYYNISMGIRDEGQSIAYLQKAFDIFDENNLKKGVFLCNCMISDKFYEQKDFDNAILYARKILEIAKQTKTKNNFRQAYVRLTTTLMDKAVEIPDKIDTSLLNEAARMCKLWEQNMPQNPHWSIRLNHININARIAFYQKRYQEALTLLLGVSDVFKADNIHAEEKRLAECFYWVYEALGDFENALHYYKIFIKITLDLKNTEARKHAETLQTQYETREKEAQITRLEEIENLKTRFFSQITHELRTPLTLILGPAQQIPKIKNYEEINHQAAVIERNADRLLQLVNQLLDLSKLEADKMQLKVREGSFSIFAQRLLNVFQHLATQQQIQLDFINDMDEEVFVLFDADKVEKIIYNLLSNAFKFTASQGRIVCQLSDEQSNETNTQIKFIVSDTGKGISAEALPHIFNRFYQADDSYTREAEGTGIGLSLVKEMTNLMNGTIEVASKVDEGTTFTLSLPMQIAEGEHHIESDYSPSSQPLPIPAPTPSDTSPKTEDTPVLLLIEDNTDMHGYIKSIFQDEYIILQAYDGNEGIEIAKKRIPDLIISDVMMPEKDGYQVCQELKNDTLTNHIPIILLTAKAALKSRIEGFEHGADAYISKPFSAEELLLQVQNLIATAQNMREQYAQSDTSQSGDMQPVFLQQVTEIIGQNIQDDQLNAEQLSTLIHLSRSQLYRKIKALTGYNISEFIRITRLNRAKTLLEQQAGNVSQIAYDVGLQPGYLSRSFTKHFGYSPKSLLKS